MTRNLIFLGITMPKIVLIGQLFRATIYIKISKSLKLNSFRNHYAEFEIYRTILTCLNLQKRS